MNSVKLLLIALSLAKGLLLEELGHLKFSNAHYALGNAVLTKVNYSPSKEYLSGPIEKLFKYFINEKRKMENIISLQG